MNARPTFLLRALALLLATLAISAALIGWHEVRLAQVLANDDLRALGAVQRAVERRYARETALRAEMIAGNQAVTGYITQALDSALPGMAPDYTSIADLLEERRVQLGLSLIAILDAKGNVLASTDRLTGPLSYGASPVFGEVRAKKASRNGLLIEDERLMDMQILPLAEYGFSEIYLLVASPLDARFVRTIVEDAGSATGADAAMVVQSPQGNKVVASTLSAEQAEALAAAVPAHTVSSIGVDLGGDRRTAATTPLFGDKRAHVVLLSSTGRADAVRSAVRWPLLAGAVIAVIAVLLALWWFHRRWWASFDALSRIAVHAADSGDLRMRASVAGPMAPLADAFNRLSARASAALARRSGGA
jgi:hypothetical protein